jgi:hypothetical protein
MYPISDPANYVLDMHRHNTGRAGRNPVVHPRRRVTKLRRPSILAGVVAAAVAVVTPAVTADARPVEGGGVPVDPPACSALQELITEADSGHLARKAKAIIGLDGPNADVELARIRAAVSASCTV